ncbi:hypothetical protein DCAR_0729374 [Daucus carota subsp. sativus]|uniref:Uncharacterized protein n=1 Tax=Daucus carota subsp. sativus TaxID=79200 RepID=A0A161ZQ07_DAUCS|nr:hypothetical protein DCAR_0729374 [Daucus carota subsp. sativus]
MVGLADIPIVGKFVEKVSEYTVDAVFRVREEKANGNTIEDYVSKWETDVEEIQKSAAEELSPSCSCIQYLPISNPISRFRICRNVVKKAEAVTQRINSGKEHLTGEIAYLPEASSLLLDSGKDNETKVHDIIRDVARSVAFTDPEYAFLQVTCKSQDLPSNDNYHSQRFLRIDAETDDVHFNEHLGFPDLHTLWLQSKYHPQQFSGGFFCIFANLSCLMLQKVNDNIRVLEGLWPSIVAGNTNEIFWRNEWYKHGSRSGLLAREYINMIIGVANPQVLNNIFNEAGIVPDANNPYTRDRIEDAIKKATGFHALIKCETNEDDNLVLKQVRLCTTYSIINQATVPLPAHCTQKKNPSCGDVNQPPANILLLPAPPLAP